ncbi:hypothetical protein SODG_006964 [Sodalis praecaptivus]|nr:hypothetical protein NVIRENTERO_01523 [Sodalis praecaptivus]
MSAGGEQRQIDSPAGREQRADGYGPSGYVGRAATAVGEI